MRTLTRIVLVSLLLWTASDQVCAQDRTLFWKSLAVSAELDREGRLHVRETHRMVFDGAWNGGERWFRLRHGQRFEFAGLYEIDAVSGERREFVPGPMNHVGEYAWHDEYRLRWRGHSLADPPFHWETRTYEIDYVLSSILLREGSQYVLDHDFAFPDRPGVIADFTRTLQLDPVWEPQTAIGPRHLTSLVVGGTAVERIVLRYKGPGKPSAVAGPMAQLLGRGSHHQAWLVFGVLCSLALAYAFAIARHERSRGRFEPLVPLDAIDADWLQEYVFRFAPEVVGATWDRCTSTYEVAAALSRMSLEGKITTKLQDDVLHLTLHCEPDRLQGYERLLIKALFGRKHATNSDELQRRYRSKGFDPVGLIRKFLEAGVTALVGKEPTLPRSRGLLTALLFLAGAVICAIAIAQWPASAGYVVLMAAASQVCLLIGRSVASRYRQTPFIRPGLVAIVALAVAAALALLVSLFLTRAFEVSGLAFIGIATLAWASLNSIHNAMQAREPEPVIALRRRLASARRYFQCELRSAAPRLKDEWLPYILAFGLGQRVDKWLRVHARAKSDDRPLYGNSFDHGSGLGSGTSGSAGWSGGGGKFGGAGATGSWVSAVGGIAGGVMAESSGGGGGGFDGGGSGSGGGGGGGDSGGGSSGGGGGGGW